MVESNSLGLDSITPNFGARAEENRKKGDAALKGTFMGNMFWSSKQDRKDDAIEFYKQAANCYKQNKDYESAVEMYIKCSNCESDEGFKANYYRDAAAAIKTVDTERYIKYTRDAIRLFQISGRTTQACSMCKECAEKLEEDYNYELARVFYQDAAGLYEVENQVSYMNQMNGKWADLTVLMMSTGNLMDIAQVIKTYDKIGKKYLQKSLVRSSASDYFFRAVLCFLANEDLPGAKNSIEDYTYEDPTFDTSKQKMFLNQMVDAIEAGSSDQLSQVIMENSRTMSLDKVTTKLLSEIKNAHCGSRVVADPLADAGQQDGFDFTEGGFKKEDKQEEPKAEKPAFDFT